MIEAVDLGAENDERMARLREALALGDGFQLVIVQVEPGEQREEVVRRLAGWSARKAIPELELVCLAPGESPMMRLSGDHAGAILVGLEAGADHDERTRAMLAELNWSRDRLPEMVRGPLVLVVSQRVQTALFELAPDFYSWRTHSASIALQPHVLGRPVQWFKPDPGDPAELETMIVGTASLRPPAVRELGRLYARLARARASRGEDAEAEAALDAAYDAYVRAGTPDDRVDLLLLRSEIATRRGRNDEASVWLEKARRQVGSGPPNSGVAAKLLSHEVLLALERRDFESAAAALPSAIEAARVQGNQVIEATMLLAQVSLPFRSAPTSEGEVALLERAVELFRGAGQLALEAGALTLLAGAAARAGRGDQAEQYSLDAVARAEASGSADAVAEARANLGRIASDNGHLELADEVLRDEVAAISPHASGRLAEARARLALHRGDDADAEHNFRAALEAYRREGSPGEIAEVSLEVGKLGRRAQNWTLALTGFEAADRLGDTKQRALAALGLAGLALDRGDRTAAVADQLLAVIQMLVGAGDATLADIARIVRGGVLMALGRDAEARTELEAALSGFETRGQAKHAAQVRDLLAQLGKRNGPRTSD